MTMPNLPQIYADRVRETSTTTGTGTLSLAGAVSKYQGLVAAIGNGKSGCYVIVNRDAAEWEVGIGVITDAAPDTLSRDLVLSSSNAGALVNFSAGTKDVFVTAPANLLNRISTHNHCLNPSFETILPGTHTSAIKGIDASEGLQNLLIPGWKGRCDSVSYPATFDTETTNISGTGSKRSASIAYGGTSNGADLVQKWDSSELCEELVYPFRGRYFCFSLDVKQSAATADVARLYITYNGTGGTTVYSSCHGANTNWERLLKCVLIPTDCTSIEFGLETSSPTPDYYADNCMVCPADVPLLELPYVPRLPVRLEYVGGDTTSDMEWTATTGSTGPVASNAASIGKSWDVNAGRPAWADRANVSIQIQNASASYHAHLYGGSNRYEAWIGGPTGVYLKTGGNVVTFGVDGQIYAVRDNTDDDVYVYNNAWIGEGL